jgi:ATP-dependent exoDNAse (exonuclease V) alpha subunit
MKDAFCIGVFLKFTTFNPSTEIFTTFDPVEKIVIAKRVQFPLKACYGIAIHKSQGMTLPELEIIHI